MPLIQTEKLGRTHLLGAREVHALRDATLQVEAGEYLAVTGPSGSGKSTLMNLLGCLDRPTSGRYLLDGRPMENLGEDGRADLRNRRIGFVFQTFHLLARVPARKSVELPLLYAGVGRTERRRRAQEALAAVGLEDRATHRPSELSGGERQRVAIAQALVNSPDLLLADEPTGNLDSRVGAEILTLFERLHRERGMTVIVVTHDPEVAGRVPRTLRLRDGAILDDLVFIPARSAERLFNASGIFELVLSAPDAEGVPRVNREARQVLLDRHDGHEDFTVTNQGDMLSMLTSLLTSLQYALVGIAAISLLVGGIGIMNIVSIVHVGVTEAFRAVEREPAADADVARWLRRLAASLAPEALS